MPTAQQTTAATFIQEIDKRGAANLTAVDAQRAMVLGLTGLGQAILSAVAGQPGAADALKNTISSMVTYIGGSTPPPTSAPTPPIPAPRPAPTPRPPGTAPGTTVDLPPPPTTKVEPPPDVGPKLPDAAVPGAPAPDLAFQPPAGEGLLVGGGQQQAQQAMDAARLAIEAKDLEQRAELGRLGLGQQLLEHLSGIARDPFSIVPALQAYGVAGGGTLAPAVDLAATGGRGRPSPYGDVYEQLIRRLSGETLGGSTFGTLGAGIDQSIGVPSLGAPTTPGAAGAPTSLFGAMDQAQATGQPIQVPTGYAGVPRSPLEIEARRKRAEAEARARAAVASGGSLFDVMSSYPRLETLVA